MKIESIKINGLIDPIGIDEETYVISWIIGQDDNDPKDVKQTAYEVEVKDARTGESKAYKKSDSDEQTVTFEIKGVSPRSAYCVSVSLKLSTGETLSERSFFETGFLGGSWEAKWIGTGRPMNQNVDMGALIATMNPENAGMEKPADSMRDLYPVAHFERHIKLKDEKIEYARAYATAHGAYSLHINKERVSDQELAPEFSSYDSLLQYQTYDVTDQLKRAGKGADVTMLLADGYYIGRIGMVGVGYEYGDHIDLMARIDVKYADGTCDTFVTDESWRWGDTNICYSDIFIGEKQDLTAAWEDAVHEVAVYENDNTVLKGQMAEPLRVIERIPAAGILTTPAGETVIDFGQVICGVTEITFAAEAPCTVTLEHQETLDENGNFFYNIPRFNCEMQDVYVLGSKPVTVRPYFTIHGFRYVMVSGYEGELKASDCTALVIASDCRKTGNFACSDERLNRLEKNIYRSQVSNFVSIPTDCPQRERAGWTGDILIYGPTAALHADVYAFLRRWLYQVRADQLEAGQVPVVVPYTNGYRNMQHAIGGDTSAGWGDVIIMLPLALYEAYGDTTVLSENFAAMEKWMDYIASEAEKTPEGAENMTKEQLEHEKYLWNTGFHYGDWLYPSAVDENGNSDAFLSAMITQKAVPEIMYAICAKSMIKVCEALEDKESKAKYTNLYESIKEAYQSERINEDGRIFPDLQGVYVLALEAGLFEGERKEAAAAHLIDLIEANDNKMDAGFMSIKYFMDVIYDCGYQKKAWEMLFADHCPSWLYEVKMGATSMWESWDAIREDNKPNVTSFNHYAFGCVGEFMYRRILGIQAAEPGYKTIRIEPDFGCGLSSAKGSVTTKYGKLSVSWKADGKGGSLDVIIPVNTKAEIILKSGGTEKIVRHGSGRYHIEF